MQSLDSMYGLRACLRRARTTLITSIGPVAMRVSDKVLKCVVFVGVEKPGGFEPLGTGFVIMVRQRQVGFQYVVTAQHVLCGLREPISIRVNRKNGEAEYIKPPRGWYYHPDDARFVDVAIAPILLQLDMYDIAHVQTGEFCTDEFLTERDVGIGEALFYPGLFIHCRGQHRNHPVMRFGELSAMPVEPVITESGPIKAYLRVSCLCKFLGLAFLLFR
jgi:hypothetical protein